MAAFDHLQNMYDIAFKPRLLRSLVREHLPDEKHQLKGPVELSNVVSMVKTHQLLSESDSINANDSKLLQSWKAAVDAWVNRVLLLASADMPDKCWAGICLLGLTCQECNSERFAESYSEWLQRLQMHLQAPTTTHFLKVASCASLSDAFSRLGRLPRIKKDANSQAGRFVQPLLYLLNEDCSEAVWEGAVCLLCTLIKNFPSSVNRCYDSVEAALVAKIMSGKCSIKILKQLGHCLALLPKSKGDEESWSLMMHKILHAINVHLNDAFQGVEEESKGEEALRLLVPLGKDPLPPLGGYPMVDSSDQKTKKTERLHISSVAALMHCCCTMLTNTYPVQVRVPIRSIVALVGRVLMVDGSLCQALFPFTTSMQQEFICSELPILHSHSLELFKAVIKGVRSQLLPQAPLIVRILTEYFKKCSLPCLRIEVYTIIRILLLSMGVGVAFYLSKEVIDNAFVDLDFNDRVEVRPSSNVKAKVSSELPQPLQKKRKHGKMISLVEQPDKAAPEVGPLKSPMPLPLKIAALQALKAVLTVGGALGADSWRPSVDRLLMTVATNACEGGWAKEEIHVNKLNEVLPTLADFQLAALEALLVSLLSPARYRPPHLARGLDLFRRGMRETGSKLAEFCAHALLALEALIHPRALPLTDYMSPSNNSSTEVDSRYPNVFSYGDKQNDTPFSRCSSGREPHDPNPFEDDLYKSWVAEDDGMEIQATEVEKNDEIQTEKYQDKIRVPSPEKISAVSDSVSGRMPEPSLDDLASVEEAKCSKRMGDENIVEAQRFQEPIRASTQPVTIVSSNNVEPGPTESETVTNTATLEIKPSEVVVPSSKSINDWVSVMESAINFTVEVDSDMDPLPDIVDEDEDEDSD